MNLTRILLENLKTITEIGLGKGDHNFLRKLLLKTPYSIYPLIFKNTLNYWLSNWDLLSTTKYNLFQATMISECTFMHLFGRYLFGHKKQLFQTWTIQWQRQIIVNTHSWQSPLECVQNLQLDPIWDYAIDYSPSCSEINSADRKYPVAYTKLWF